MTTIDAKTLRDEYLTSLAEYAAELADASDATGLTPGVGNALRGVSAVAQAAPVGDVERTKEWLASFAEAVESAGRGALQGGAYFSEIAAEATAIRRLL